MVEAGRSVGAIGLRRLGLIVHILLSVGLLGAISSFFVLVLVGMSGSASVGAFVAAERVSTLVILPLAVAGWAMGIVQALTTRWGLAKHYWVLIKLLLTSFAVIVLLAKQPLIHSIATGGAGRGQGFAAMQLLVHAAGGFAVLSIALVLSVLKPEGRTGLEV
jgi:hypothetical protein